MRRSEVIAQSFCATESHPKEAGNSQMFERSILSGAVVGQVAVVVCHGKYADCSKAMERESEGETLCRSRRQSLSIVASK